jgi:diaminopimelate decarboxylase
MADRDDHRPRFVYEEATLHDAFCGLRDAVGSCFRRGHVAFAVKCNPLPQILRTLAGLGAWFEIAWPREAELVAAAGALPGRLLWGGAFRSGEIYERAAAGGARLVVESISQLRHSLAVPGLQLCLRVRGVPSSRFGMPLPLVREAARAIAASGRSDAALQVHASGGTWPPSPEMWRTRARNIAAAADVLGDHGVAVRLLSLGGGLPEPAKAAPARADFARAALPLLEAAAEVVEDRLPDAEVIVEPGRFLVQHCGTFYTYVSDVREEAASGWAAVLANGVSTLGSLSSSSGTVQFVRRRERARGEVTLLGPSNREDDRLGQLTGVPEVGDVVRFDRIGAYQQAFRTEFAEDPPEVRWIPRAAVAGGA